MDFTTIFVIAAGLGLLLAVVIAVWWRKSTSTGTTLMPLRSRGLTPGSEHETTPDLQPEGPLAVLEGPDDATYVVETVTESPPGGLPVPAGIASQLGHELAKATATVGQLRRGGELYRLVKAPPGGLVKVAGNSSRYRGFGVSGRGVSGHGEFSKIRPSGIVSPALALTVASAALGAYWQQQLDSTLRDIQGTLRELQQRLDNQLDAQLDLAEQTLTEHEATQPRGRYDPPASVTDGMVANRIQVRELRETIARIRGYEERPLGYQDFNQEIIGEDRARLDRQIYRALRGLAVELRVLRLKRLAALTEPEAYLEELDRQADELLAELELIREVLTLVGSLELSTEHDRSRVELPRRRRRRLSEKTRAEEHRHNLERLLHTTRQLELVVSVPEINESFVELYINVSDDGSVTAMMAPTQPRGELPG